MVRVLSGWAGLTLVQEATYDFIHHGQPPNGPLDPKLARIVMEAAQVEQESGILEYRGGLELVLKPASAIEIALVMPGRTVQIASTRVHACGVFELEAGQHLIVSGYPLGPVGYLSLPGGTLQEHPNIIRKSEKRLSAEWLPNWDIPSPELQYIPDQMQQSIEAVLSLQSNRQGSVLDPTHELPQLERRVRSVPVAPGTIQQRPDGGLLVLGPDGPTIGGYAIVGYLTQESQRALYHLMLSEKIQLRPVPMEKALEQWQSQPQTP